MQKILHKLFAIQQALKVKKDQYNSFGDYNYRSCEDILEALKPYLEDQKTIISLSDKVFCIGGEKENIRFYVESTATICCIETGETYSTTACAREDCEKKKMDGSQLTGSASSYARKYALNGLLALDDTKDSDSTNKHGKDNSPKHVEKVNKTDPV